MIVSNCQKGYIEAFLAAHGLGDFFEDFECSGRTGFTKGKNIRLVMERNRIKEAAYIGDTLLDYAAAREAGIPFVHAAYGFGYAESASFVIHSLWELPAAVSDMEKSI